MLTYTYDAIARRTAMAATGQVPVSYGWTKENPLRERHLYGRCANSQSIAERMISSSEEEVGCHPKVEINNEGSATS